MKRAWCLSFLFIFTGPAMAAPACELFLRENGVHAEECRRGAGKEISLKIGGEGGFAVRAEFDPKINARMFRRIAPLGTSRALRAEDQKAFRQALRAKGEENMSKEARALAKFLTEFAEPGYLPKSVDLSGLASRAALQSFATTTILCEKLGQRHTGYFTARGQAWKQTAVVGGHGCMGKCGPGCAPDDRWDRGTYTEECFNHDLCCTMTGDNMGDCEDEFWEAASGFLSAPHCMFVEKRRGS